MPTPVKLQNYGDKHTDWAKHDCQRSLETYSRIGLLQSYWNLQSYWTTTKLWKLTVVLTYVFVERRLEIGTPFWLHHPDSLPPIWNSVSTRFECNFTSSPLVSSVILRLPHSFRVWILLLKMSGQKPPSVNFRHLIQTFLKTLHIFKLDQGKTTGSTFLNGWFFLGKIFDF
jgi:hypothetical protein